MKKIYILILSAVVLFAATSCADLLEKAPADQVTSANMWTTPDLALKGMNGLYEAFYSRDLSSPKIQSSAMDGINKYGIEGLGFCTDHYSNGVQLALLSYQTKGADDVQILYEWRFGYTIIHSCNDAIQNLSAAGLDEETYERYICEAKFLRAWAYQRLNKLFQGVPIYLEPVSNDECTRTQSTADEVWDVIIDDLTYCIDNEYCPDNTLTSNFGRPSKGAAYALRGMSYMWMEEWQKAADDFSKVSECGYSLWTGEYADFFTADAETSAEMIFAIQYDAESGYCDNIQLALGARDTYGSWDEIKPAPDFVDYYQNADGTTFNWADVTGLEAWDNLTAKERCVFFCRDGLNSNSNYSTQKQEAINMCGEDVFNTYYLDDGNEDRIRGAYDNRDPRLAQTVVTPYEPIDCYSSDLNNGENMIGKELRWPLYDRGTDGGDLWLDQRTSGYYMYKKYVRFLKDELVDRAHCYTDFPLIRYTDVLLQWAEAEIELGNYSSAVDMINQVRSRANMPSISTGTQDEMREAVRYERRVEFPVEAVNFFDEIRWRTYKETKFAGLDIHGNQCWWGDDTVGYSWYWDDCLYTWPCPSAEYQRNSNLVPRDGWNY